MENQKPAEESRYMFKQGTVKVSSLQHIPANLIGRRNKLRVLRTSTPGVYLDGGEQLEILLPGRYVPPGTKPGDSIEVFVYPDSEDRLVATTETPRAMVGDFAYLKVVSINARVGAFLDWGLTKDLLLPFREQANPVRIGQWVTAYILLDPASHRIVATTRLNQHLPRTAPPYVKGQPVNLLITARTPLGYNAIVENAHRGLLYHTAGTAPLDPGQKVKGFVCKIRTDGKIDLSLDTASHKRVPPLIDVILLALQKNNGKLAFDDSTPPEIIREKFGVSKNAFKLALSTLYRQRRIQFTHPGIELAGKQ